MADVVLSHSALLRDRLRFVSSGLFSQTQRSGSRCASHLRGPGLLGVAKQHGCRCCQG
jgi:hypothetical protein